MLSKFIKLAQTTHKEYIKLGPKSQELHYTQPFLEMIQAVKGINSSDFNLGPQTFKQFNGYAYADLYTCPKHDICMGLFHLSKGETLPLHDHPGMWIITKVLYGSAKLRAMVLNSNDRKYQWQYQNQIVVQKNLKVAENPPEIEAEETASIEVKAGNFDFVGPVHNNLHEFVANQDFVFFNCYIPHYDKQTRFANWYEKLEKIDSTWKLKMHHDPTLVKTDYHKHFIQCDTDCKFLQDESIEQKQQQRQDQPLLQNFKYNT